MASVLLRTLSPQPLPIVVVITVKAAEKRLQGCYKDPPMEHRQSCIHVGYPPWDAGGQRRLQTLKTKKHYGYFSPWRHLPCWFRHHVMHFPGIPQRLLLTTETSDIQTIQKSNFPGFLFRALQWQNLLSNYPEIHFSSLFYADLWNISYMCHLIIQVSKNPIIQAFLALVIETSDIYYPTIQISNFPGFLYRAFPAFSTQTFEILVIYVTW